MAKTANTYQLTFYTIELKKAKALKSKGVYTSKLKPLHTTFLHSIKLSWYSIGIKFDKDPLAVEQNIYTTNIVNEYIICDLDTWPRNTINSFKL